MALITYVLLTMCPFHQNVKRSGKQLKILLVYHLALFVVYLIICLSMQLINILVEQFIGHNSMTVGLSATLCAVAKGHMSHGRYNYNDIILAAHGWHSAISGSELIFKNVLVNTFMANKIIILILSELWFEERRSRHTSLQLWLMQTGNTIKIICKILKPE